MSGGTAAAATLALTAGLAGSVQVAVMGRFGERIGAFEVPLTWPRMLGVLLLAIGALLALRRA